MNNSLLAGLAGSPLTRVAVKYWWLALPSAFAMWQLSKKREKVDTIGVLQDFGVAFGPIIPIIMLCEMMHQKDAQGGAAAAPAAAPVATFTTSAPADDAIPASPVGVQGIPLFASTT